MLNQESDEKLNNTPPFNEGDSIRWIETTPNGFQHWRIKSGVFQFTNFTLGDFNLLAWGDRVQESQERGSIRYLNVCSGCYEKFLSGTMILVPYFCDNCRTDYYQLLKIANSHEITNPKLYQGIMDYIDAVYESYFNKKLIEKETINHDNI